MATNTMQQAPSEAMQRCIDDCHTCATTCQSGLQHCFMQMQGKDKQSKDSDLIMLMMDCIDLCDASVHLMQRRSPEHPKMCGICADVARRCAQACRETDDVELEFVVEACDACAMSCEAMAGADGRSDARASQRRQQPSMGAQSNAQQPPM